MSAVKRLIVETTLVNNDKKGTRLHKGPALVVYIKWMNL